MNVGVLVVVKVVDWYTEELLAEHPDWYFVFGDNDMREGTGGQAKVCRGKPNVIGVRTKKKPSYGDDAYYTDKELPENFYKISQDFADIDTFLTAGAIVVLPRDGLGTGYAELNMRAPLTLRFIELMTDVLKNHHGVEV